MKWKSKYRYYHFATIRLLIISLSVINRGLKGLVNIFAGKIEPALVHMSKMPWGSWESEGDQSDYVNQIATYTEQTATIFSRWLNNNDYYRYVLDLFCK